MSVARGLAYRGMNVDRLFFPTKGRLERRVDAMRTTAGSSEVALTLSAGDHSASFSFSRKTIPSSRRSR